MACYRVCSGASSFERKGLVLIRRLIAVKSHSSVPIWYKLLAGLTDRLINKGVNNLNG